MIGDRAMKLKALATTIQVAARDHGIGEDFLRALILTENDQVDPLAIRFEPSFWANYVEGRGEYLRHPWYPWPEVLASSYGLVQVMFTSAEWAANRFGVRWSGSPWDLFVPSTNLAMGAAILGHKMTQFGVRDGIAAYNAGTPRRIGTTGTLANEAYVARFERWIGRPLS
jgi:hypothetical protein